jgi:hypothetical protein
MYNYRRQSNTVTFIGPRIHSHWRRSAQPLHHTLILAAVLILLPSGASEDFRWEMTILTCHVTSFCKSMSARI